MKCTQALPLLLGSLLLGLAPASAQGAASTQSAPQAPTVAKSNLIVQPGYSFTAAGGWISLKNGQGNTALVGPALQGKANINFTVIVTDLSQVSKANRTLGVARDVRYEEMSGLVSNLKWLGERSVKVTGGSLGVLWSYSGTEKESGDAFRWTQLMTLKGDRLYTVTLSVPDGTRPDVAAAGRAMLDTFALR